MSIDINAWRMKEKAMLERIRLLEETVKHSIKEQQKYQQAALALERERNTLYSKLGNALQEIELHKARHKNNNAVN